MPLPTNYSRPTLPYDPLQSLPNDQRFALLTTLQQSPTAEMFDAEFNAVIDKMNTLADAINNVVAGSIPGSDNPLNAGKFLVTDGAGNLSFIVVGSDNISPNTITTALLQDQVVTRAKIGDGAVGSTQLAEACVTALQLAEGAVTANKIPVGSLPLSKFIKPTTASVIGGTTTAGGSWYEETVADYQVVSKKPGNNGTKSVDLSYLWDHAPNTFDGGKLDPASIDGSIAMMSNKTPLATMKSTGTAASVICGRTTDQKFTEVALGDLQIISKTTNATTPSAMNLSTVFNNEGGTPYNGSQLTDGSVPQKKINNYKQFAPFCMGSVNADGSRNKSLNIQGITKNGTGLYRIAFTTAAGDANYVCLPVVNDGSGAVARTSDKSTQAVVIRVTNMGGGNVDAGFDFEIKDW